MEGDGEAHGADDASDERFAVLQIAGEIGVHRGADENAAQRFDDLLAGEGLGGGQRGGVGRPLGREGWRERENLGEERDGAESELGELHEARLRRQRVEHGLQMRLRLLAVEVLEGRGERVQRGLADEREREREVHGADESRGGASLRARERAELVLG